MPKNKCRTCGRILLDRRKKYCSRVCRQKVCSDCGKEITRKSKSGLCRSCFMKQEWADKHFGERRGGAISRYWDNHRLPRNFCVDCGQEISRRKAQGRYSMRCKRCAAVKRESSAIRRKQQSERSKTMWKSPDFRARQSEVMRALWQDEKFRVNILNALRKANSSDAHRRAVSEAKKRQWADGVYNDIFYGENHPNWKGGISFESYGPEFNNSLKDYVRGRDDYICAICGKPTGVEGYCIPVHHIDYDKKNNDPMNLISLCESCHAKTNFNRRFWQIILAPVARRREKALDIGAENKKELVMEMAQLSFLSEQKIGQLNS